MEHQIFEILSTVYWTLRYHLGDAGLVSFLVLTKFAWFD